jgi:hypothetical protein
MLGAAPLPAQNLREVGDVTRPRALFGLNFQLAFPQGEFADFVGTGVGIGGNLSFFLNRQRSAGIRIFGSWIEYGRTTSQIPYPGLPGISVDLTTANDIYSFGVGPEFHAVRGDLRPYFQAAFGGSNFRTSTSAHDESGFTIASSTNFDDWTWALYGGAGLMYQISHGRTPFFLDLAARYQTHGRTRYLREGSLEPAPGGGVIVDPVESKTDLLIVHLGLQIGL